jgi:hypothetical protein
MRLLLAFLALAMVCGCACVPGQNAPTAEEAPDGPVCPAPYMREGPGCCLDRDGSGVCDRDEETATTEAPATEPTVPEEPEQAEPTTTAPAPTTTVRQTTSTAEAPTTTHTTTSTTTTSTTSTTTLPPHCTDTDGGRDRYVFGATKRGADLSADRCLVPSTLIEYYCNGTAVASETIQCPLGCLEGVCVSCDDTDGGNVPSEYGIVTLGKTLMKKDLCSKIGDGKTLQEYYCATKTEIGSAQVYCDGGCDNGRCL